MKFYFAARFGRRTELVKLRSRLDALGHQVTSRWLDTTMPAVDTGPTASAPEDRETHALQDWQDLRAADVVVAFTEDPDGPPISSRGGRHVEFGIAMEMDKNLCVVGYRENIWHFLSAVKFFESQWDFLRFVEAQDAAENWR